jgi:hypothetical protein
MSSFGTRLRAIDEIVRQTASDPSMSAPDYRLLADKLEGAARQVRTIALCAEPTTVARPSRRVLKLMEIA